ncbi:hypothetical protein GGX14DRAFT_575144 [Mycena pura]|uniref:Uncharacterized protein n=1 Tax=Mycena pura TaxID=153505 RepID=A0AAD6Y105_9AGAR|nr:hypothetical protein GGX14DRAFT_575144 [Mycena pura]
MPPPSLAADKNTCPWCLARLTIQCPECEDIDFQPQRQPFWHWWGVAASRQASPEPTGTLLFWPGSQPAACTCRLAKTLVGAFLLRSVARNDIFDHEVDARRRRNRPLPGGRMYYICLSSTCWGIASTMQVMVALIVCTFGGITLRVVRPARRACTPGFQPSAERHGARYTECRTSPFRAHTVRALAGAQLSQPWLAIAVHATCTFGGVTLHSRSLRTHSTPSPADRVGAGPDTFARVWSTQPKQWPRTSRQLRKGRHHRWTSMGAEGGRLDACARGDSSAVGRNVENSEEG